MSDALLNSLATALSSDGVERIGWSLVHSLWQFCLLALTALVLDQVLRQNSVAARYWMLVSMMLLTVAMPLATWLALGPKHPVVVDALSPEAVRRGRYGGSSDSGANQREPTNRSDVAGGGQLSSQRRAAPNRDALAAENRQSELATEPGFVAAASFWSRSGGALRPWLPTVVALWSLGVLAFSLRPALSWYTVRRLCKVGVAAVEEPVRQAFIKLKQTLVVRRSVEVFQSTLVDAPIVVGCFRSVILLPVSLVGGLPPAQLEAILAHELAHVRRYDYLINLLQTLIESLFFYHPAVWWLSHRVRVERENCCDDLVVVALGDRVQYGRALLAIEENRGAASILALGARDGCLLSRIQRLSRISTVESQSRVGDLTGLVFAAVALGVVIWAMSSGLAEVGVAAEVGFGPESHGLRCRLVALSPAVNDDSPDLKNIANSFTQSADMTFAVELKNVSSKTLTLVGLRYAEGYAEAVRGTLRTEMLAPHLIDFEFTDKDGNALPRTHREYFEGWHVLHNASTHDLIPGQSLTMVLRPAKFNVPMDHDLPSGDYRVKVRYRGPDDSLRTNVRMHWPDKPILEAWSHEVESNPIEFTIERASRRAKPEDLAWGEPVDGLRAALEYRLPSNVDGNPLSPPGVPIGTTLGVIFHLQNVSHHPITFISETGRQGDYVSIRDDKGNKVEVKSSWISGWPIDVLWKLAPGNTAQLHVLAPAINALDQPGRYTVRYTVRFNSRILKDGVGKVIFPRPGDYDKELDTGETLLILCRQRSPAEQAQSEPPFRLPDHGTIQDVRFLADGNEIATISVQGGVSVRRWDVAKRQLLSEIKLAGDKHGRAIRQKTLQLSSDGRRVIGATDAYVGIWDTASGDLLKTLMIPTKEWEYDRVRCLDCSPDLSTIVAGLGTTYEKTTLLYDGYSIAWDVASGESKRLVAHNNSYYFRDIAMSSDGTRFATCNEHGGGVSIWETSSGKLLHDFSADMANWKSPDPELVKNNMVNAVAFSPDDQLLAISGTFGVKLVDSDSGNLHCGMDVPYRYHSGHTSLAFSADGSRLARFGAGGRTENYSVPIWSTKTGERLTELSTEANAGAFSEDASAIAIGISDFYEALEVWPLYGKVVTSFAHPPAAYPRIDRVEENTHHRGKKADEFVAKWEPVWGEAQHGIQYGVAFTVSKDVFRVGERVSMAAFLRNVGDKPQQIDIRPDMFGNPPQAMNAAGEPINFEKRALLGDVAHYRDTLAPGESFGPLYLSLGLGENPRPGQQNWAPYWAIPVVGKVKLTHMVSFKVASPGVSSVETSNQWNGGKLTSGTIEFAVIDGRVSQSQKLPSGDDAVGNAANQPKSTPKTDQSKLPWRATGRVTDGDGNALAGVTVRAATGVGTLIGGGSTVTDADGQYDLRFGMGIMFGDITDEKPSPQTQFALISARLDGYFEKNFNRHGNGIASLEPVESDVAKGFGVEPNQICLPNKPREVNFVMLQAARVAGTLIGENNQPLKGFSVSLTGDQLPPGSSVLAQVRTDEQGRFKISGIPTTAPFQFEVRKPHSELKPPWDDSWATGPLVFAEPGDNDLAASLQSEQLSVKRFTVKSLTLKILGPGVHGKTAVARARKREPLALEDSAKLAADIIAMDELTLKLTNE